MNTIDTRTPVTIITGFLGAGKTTLLNQIIEQNKTTIPNATIAFRKPKYFSDQSSTNYTVRI